MLCRLSLHLWLRGVLSTLWLFLGDDPNHLHDASGCAYMRRVWEEVYMLSYPPLLSSPSLGDFWQLISGDFPRVGVLLQVRVLPLSLFLMAFFWLESGELSSAHQFRDDPTVGVDSSKRKKLAEFRPSMIKSKISPRMLRKVRDHYRFPSYYLTSAPQSDERINNPLRGSFGLYVDHLKAGLGLPLHPFFLMVFEAYDIVPGQLTPNSIRTICAFVMMCHIVKVEPTLSLSHVFFILKRDSRGLGWWMFGSRPDRKLIMGLHSAWSFQLCPLIINAISNRQTADQQAFTINIMRRHIPDPLLTLPNLASAARESVPTFCMAWS